MANDNNIYDIQRRAAELAKKTKIDSISPGEVGELIGDLASYTDDVEINGSALGIRKTYKTISEMEADQTPKDDTGKPLKKGMLVNIYNQDDPDAADNGKVFSWQNPGWQLRTKMDAGYATRAELEQLENRIERVFDGGTAASKYGGARVIDCGRADSIVE